MKKYILAICTAFLTIYSYAQKISVAAVEERRSTTNQFFQNQCIVSLKLTGDEVRKYKFLKLGGISKAVDDQGLDMLLVEKNEPEYKEITTNNAEFQATLNIASRKASSIKDLGGSLKLYAPVTNESVYVIENFQQKVNKNLLPDKLPVKMFFMSKDSLDKIKSTAKQGVNIAEGFMQAFAGVFGSAVSMKDSPNKLAFYLDGDASKIVSIIIQDASGKPVSNTTRTIRDNLVVYYFRDKPSANWQVVVHVETSNSLKVIPFALSNIDLP